MPGGMSPCRAERCAGPYMPRSCERIKRDAVPGISVPVLICFSGFYETLNRPGTSPAIEEYSYTPLFPLELTTENRKGPARCGARTGKDGRTGLVNG